jgi:hypothetical protein
VTGATLGVMSSADLLLTIQLGILLLVALAVAVGRAGADEGDPGSAGL